MNMLIGSKKKSRHNVLGMMKMVGGNKRRRIL